MISEPYKINGLKKYIDILNSHRQHGAWHDLAFVSGLATMGMLLVLLDMQRSLGMVVTIPLVCVFPGYALLTALFPHPELDRPTRLLLSVSLSITLSVLIGLVLNRLPLGLRASSWAIALWFVTIAGCMIALMRRMFAKPLDQQAQRAGLGVVTVWQGLRLNSRQLALIGVAVLISGGALALAQYQAQRQPPANTMQLWVLPDTQGKVGSLRVGIASVGSASGAFKLLVTRDGVTLHQWALDLSPGEQWEQTIFVAPGLISQAIDVRLYRDDKLIKVERSVRFWLEPNRN